MALSKLLPCPFCASTDLVPLIIADNPFYACVACETCNAQGPQVSYTVKEGSEAAYMAAKNLWNTRPTPPAARATPGSAGGKQTGG